MNNELTSNKLKDSIDFYVASGLGDNIVLVDLAEPSVGARASSIVLSITPGIDWEHGQMRISTLDELCRKGRAKDDIMEIRIFEHLYG